MRRQGLHRLAMDACEAMPRGLFSMSPETNRAFPKKAHRSGTPDVGSAARPIFRLACADHTLRAQGHRSRYPRADSHVRMMGKKKQWRRSLTLFIVGSVLESEYCLKACMICLRPDAICVATLPPVSSCLPIRVRFRCQSLHETFAFNAHMCRHGHPATLPPLS